MESFMTLKNQLCFAIYEVSSELTKLYTSTLQPFELTYPQYLVLLALWEQDELTVSKLGQKLALGTGTLTPMLSRLEKNGWIRKTRSTTDERVVHVQLEPKAIQAKPEILQAIGHLINTCGIEVEEYTELMSQLQDVKQRLQHYRTSSEL